MTAAFDHLAPLGPIQYLTIHCTATPEGRDNSAAEVTRWDIERFGQPSYHWTIELDGTAVATLPESRKGAHTGKRNSGNIGISYVGGTEALNAGGKPKDTRTTAQKVTLLGLVRDYKRRFPSITVLGHRDWPGVAKVCPSFNVASWLRAEGLQK